MSMSGGSWVEPASRWIMLDGPTHYADFGGPEEGPLVVCVHGLSGSHRNWVDLAPRLTAVARVLALDLPGHGRTPPDGRGLGIRSLRRLLHRFVAEAGGGPAILVGNSMGGLLSLLEADPGFDARRRATAAEPAGPTVAGLVLLDPALPRPRGARADPAVVRMFAALAVPGLGERMMAHQRARVSVERQVRDAFARNAADPSTISPGVLAAHVALLAERTDHARFDGAMLTTTRSLLARLASRGPAARSVGRVTAPTMVVHGEADRMVPVGVARHLAELRPDWRVETRPGVGHLPQVEDAAGTADLIMDWFGREGRAAVETARGAAGPRVAAA